MKKPSRPGQLLDKAKAKKSAKVKGKKVKAPRKPGDLINKFKAKAAKLGGNPTSSKTSTVANPHTQTSTVANPKNNITVTGGAGKGNTIVHIHKK